MAKATVCHIFEAIGNQSAIARAAMWGVRKALDSGYKVTVVTHLLDESLRGEVEWLRTDALKRLFFFQYASARHWVRGALKGRTFDIVHAQQAQICSMADVMQCHFLTRVAYERGGLENRRAPRQMAVRLQQQGVLYLEDWYFQNLKPETRMLFDSAMLQQEFVRLYGKPKHSDVLVLAAPTLNIASDEERAAARLKLIGEGVKALVVGFLGGIVEHKGWRRMLEALQETKDIFLLMGGPDTDTLDWPALRGRYKGLGQVRDAATFYAACDVLIVPSLFEPLGMVTFDAVARGIPVVATPEVGSLPYALAFNTGLEWRPHEPLEPVLREAASRRFLFHRGAKLLCDDLSSERQGERLMAVYDDVLREKQSGASSRKSETAVATA